MNREYTIVAYDKDGDVYVRLATVYRDYNVATLAADFMATLGLKRLNGEPYDWIEVVDPHDDSVHYYAQCE